ncbi:malate dehydrogenase, mitochondrial-like [Vespa velutina]|uniref:malate dehydrogenase, mitochondrial-like n=1 Tax=Vespa velutina TaxID=202808 RepID=UPI001FB416C3|nr:malate dehydrogenase, mitochondrial-like [Vespa velutina]
MRLQIYSLYKMLSILEKHIFRNEFLESKLLPMKLSKREGSNDCLPRDRSELHCIYECRVAIIGLGGVGKSLAHLLKMFPGTLTELRLLNRSDPSGIIEELNHIPTKLPIFGMCGMENLCKGLKDVDIVVISAGYSRKTDDSSREDLFSDNAKICANICKACSEACPTALIAIVANPIDTLVPLAAHILKKHGSYNPAKLFGVCELDHLRARHYFADLICMDPKWTYVPVVGGHGEHTTVPLFSRCRPNIELTPEEMMNLTKAVRIAGKNIVKMKKSSSTYSMASAAMYFIHKLARAIHHEPNIVISAYTESRVTGAHFFSNELLLGPAGIDKNLGFGRVNVFEQKLIDDAVKVLRKQVDMINCGKLTRMTDDQYKKPTG